MKIGSRKDRFCEFDHHRKVSPVDARTVIRMKRDAFWSAAGSDVDAGATTVTLPDAAAASPWAVINCAPVRRDTVCARPKSRSRRSPLWMGDWSRQQRPVARKNATRFSTTGRPPRASA
jgi:hypothetical protein